jgi:DNA-binding MarR family transcriptional regulator
MPSSDPGTQPPAADDRAAEVTALVRAVYRHAGALSAEMVGQVHDIHPTDHNAIRLLEHAASRPTTVGQLGRELGLSSASVSEMVDRLERAGYVRRERDEADRRRVLVHLTGTSRDMARSVLAPLLDRLQRALAARDDDELGVIADFLREVLGDDAPPPA